MTDITPSQFSANRACVKATAIVQGVSISAVHMQEQEGLVILEGECDIAIDFSLSTLQSIEDFDLEADESMQCMGVW